MTHHYFIYKVGVMTEQQLPTPTQLKIFASLYGAYDLRFDGEILYMTFPDLLTAAEFSRTRKIRDYFMISIETPKSSMSFTDDVEITVWPAIGSPAPGWRCQMKAPTRETAL